MGIMLSIFLFLRAFIMGRAAAAVENLALSLVFEWVFLCGFGGALPFALAGSRLFRERRWRLAWLCRRTTAAFAGFYWSAVAVLWLKSR